MHRRKGYGIFFCAANRRSDRTLMFLLLARFFPRNSADDKSLASLPPEPFRKLDRLNFQTKSLRVLMLPGWNRQPVGQHFLDRPCHGVSRGSGEQRDQQSPREIDASPDTNGKQTPGHQPHGNEKTNCFTTSSS